MIEDQLAAMGLEMWSFVALIGVGLATSILSAILGMAGGITLLAVMLLFYDPLVAIPLHGVVQLVSNSSRAFIQREHLRWELIGRYSVLILPMGFVGIWIAQGLPPTATRALIGLFVLAATWRPKLLFFGAHPESSDPRRRFVLLGGFIGLLNVTIGATGPLLAPFFLNLGLSRFEIIGTKAGCQILGHVSKLIIFGVVGFIYADYSLLLAGLSASVILGTWLGSRLLHKVTDSWFIILYKSVLTLIAVHLVFEAIAKLS